MIILVHQKAKKVIELIRDQERVKFSNDNICTEFFRIASENKDELILWVEQEFKHCINLEGISDIFSHALIMSSYSIKRKLIPEEIGYIDQYPFVDPNFEVKFPTWMMSSDIGGINSDTLSQFQSHLKNITDFQFLINSIAKLGQQNSLFCYSDPNLTTLSKGKFIENEVTTSFLFRFVGAHYKKVWLFVLMLAYFRYEKSFPFFALVLGIFQKSYFNKKINLDFKVKIKRELSSQIDVIIPTLERPKYLYDFLNDLKDQSHLPESVIIVEQKPSKNDKTDLEYLKDEKWPFKIVHLFTNHVGACNARNLALKEVKGDWIFFADDDIRIKKDLLKNALEEASRLDIYCLNLNCLEPGSPSVFSKIKQWASFGSGTSFVKSEYVLKCRFDETYEKGFGEDIDFGLQLRNNGCDIIFHPDLITTHLKAPRGGFRDVMNNQSVEHQNVKPSPTMMKLVKSNLSREMIRGYKMALFIKYYPKQPVKNLIKYYNIMQDKWSKSESLSQELNN